MNGWIWIRNAIAVTYVLQSKAARGLIFTQQNLHATININKFYEIVRQVCYPANRDKKTRAEHYDNPRTHVPALSRGY